MDLVLSSPLQWVEEFSYLGVQVTRRNSEFFERNLQQLLASLKTCCSSWSGLPLNLLCRINLVKIMLLQGFNYIFRNCPIWVPFSFFREIDSCLISFIWNGASPCIAKDTLSLPSRLGGLDSPNFRVYFWVAVLVSAYWWFQGSRANAAICLEAAFLGSLMDLRELNLQGPQGVSSHSGTYTHYIVSLGGCYAAFFHFRPVVPCPTLVW